jgi:hypothetical protein
VDGIKYERLAGPGGEWEMHLFENHLRHTIITELAEMGVADHVLESISSHLSRRMPLSATMSLKLAPGGIVIGAYG